MLESAPSCQGIVIQDSLIRTLTGISKTFSHGMAVPRIPDGSMMAGPHTRGAAGAVRRPRPARCPAPAKGIPWCHIPNPAVRAGVRATPGSASIAGSTFSHIPPCHPKKILPSTAFIPMNRTCSLSCRRGRRASPPQLRSRPGLPVPPGPKRPPTPARHGSGKDRTHEPPVRG